MAGTLVLCVDRDNDFGAKAGVRSPIVGRRQNLRAAVKLALADPEDSDSNSLFAAIKVFDAIREKGEPVEIATVCGDSRVGTKSDHLITLQLGEVLTKVQPESAIVVSDGPEDEWIMPVLERRLKVREIRRVVVKQSERIESTVYIIRKGLAKESIQRGLIVPLSLILVVWGTFATTGLYSRQNIAFGIPAFAVGTYLLLQALHVRERAEELYRELRAGMLAAKLTIFTSLIAFIFIFVGAAYTYQTTVSAGLPTVEESSLFFAAGFLWWTIPAIIVRWGGEFADNYLRYKRTVWSDVYISLSGVAMVFLLATAFTLVRYFLGFLRETSFQQVLWQVLAYIGVTVSIAALGALLYRHAGEKKMVQGGSDAIRGIKG